MQWITGKATRVWISLNEQTRRTMFIFLAETGKLTTGHRFMSRSFFQFWSELYREQTLLPSMCLANRVTHSFLVRSLWILVSGLLKFVLLVYISMTRSNTVKKLLIGRSCKKDEFDWLFLSRGCVMLVINKSPISSCDQFVSRIIIDRHNENRIMSL